MSENNTNQQVGTPDPFGQGDIKLRPKLTGSMLLSKKAKAGIVLVLAIVVALITVGYMGIDDNTNSEPGAKAKDEKKDGMQPTSATTPPDYAQKPNGLAVLHADTSDPVATLPGDASAPAGALPGSTQPGGAKTLPAGADGLGTTPAIDPNASAAKPPSAAEMAAEQRRMKRLQNSTAARDSGFQIEGFNVGGASDDKAAILDALKKAQTGQAGGLQPVAGQSGGGADDDQNKQARKEKFLREADDAANRNYLTSTRMPAISPYEIKASTVIPAIMEGGLNSDLPGMIKAQVRENVYDTRTGRILLIPARSKLIGTYDSQVAYGQERVLVVWNRIIFPDASELFIQGMPGADGGGYAGMTGDVDNHYVRTFSSAILTSLVISGIQLSQPQQTTNSSGQVSQPTVGQTISGQLGQQVGQAAMGIMQKNLNVQPTIRIAPGTRFNVMVSKNIVFPGPWKWK
ncbi:TrbI/VirB10 family protein [Chromobacterium vaccinii]|uniref:TrbI/VirB10 family protein n=1 Tax=Chromobacterium vaccinii TaxID=1108595 RepID=UPI003C77C2BC